MNPRSSVPANLAIRRAASADLPIVRELAHTIWRAYYPTIISPGQIEYMLAQRYAPESMEAAVRAGEITYDLLTVDTVPVAFAGHGPGSTASEWKLNQLYVLPEWHGHGLGGTLIRHVATLAREAGRSTLVLTVNRQNAQAITAYQRAGFTIREAADFPIGSGYVMQDYVMTKPLVATAASTPPRPR